ncbi:alpha/beta fold hydrolase [Mycobacterium sp. AZCC_0083]|uniref:alpha/beta fold hydrolase n=1 Tax=Mycobacterium sp. AZCC_0083 TaxID=2735882 RepID=UPI0016125C76|nr:alpha/beta hydrolase [Mycobacterium sp. AZCC_0083]MBB5166315.1 pimeloyl-ACP methyl ester carboxylesterase [Mycobacterium sp. AZCC_0083]
MTASTALDYSEIPARARKVLEGFLPDEAKIAPRVAHFADVQPRPFDQDGDTETLDGATFTHHFVDAPGDEETVRFHYVEAGDGEPIVFLHGIPDSWYQWHHQMAALSATHRCIGVDLKGYGQSDKGFGDFRHEAAAEQLLRALDLAGVDKFNVVTHDRGTVQADFIVAKHPDRVLRYGRGEQHLYHFHPDLAPQGPIFANAPHTGMMEDPRYFVVWLYTWIAKHAILDDEMRRTIQEFSYPGTNHAVPRYFNSQSFRQEWLRRRRDLLGAWTCPVMIMQGYDSKTQPREFYEDSREYIPNARSVAVEYIEAGHFWSMERPAEVTALIRRLLEM